MQASGEGLQTVSSHARRQKDRREPTTKSPFIQALSPRMREEPLWSNHLLILLQWQCNFNVSFEENKHTQPIEPYFISSSESWLDARTNSENLDWVWPKAPCCIQQKPSSWLPPSYLHSIPPPPKARFFYVQASKCVCPRANQVIHLAP
jgi:hypothetical protein